MKKIFLFSFSFLIALQAFSQNNEDEKLLKRLRYLTYEAYKVNNYNFAIVYAQKADSLEPNQTDILYMLGVSYLYSNTKPKALRPLLKAKKANYKPEEIDYYLGQAYHYNNKFDSAIYYFKKHLPKINTSEDATDLDKEMLREITIGLKQCEYGKLMVLDSAQVEIKNMGPNINTQYSEYLPLVTADESIMFFTSRRPRAFHKLDSDQKYFENIYATYFEDSAWSKPVLLEYPANDSHHGAGINISPDGQKLFIYKSKSASEAKGNIYTSTLRNGSLWTVPKKLGTEINSKAGWESSVCVTSSGKRLYFSSDREGGKGGFDIYYSDWDAEKEKWGEPINMGAPINTPANEDAPYIHFDGKTLFFSTDGHETMGGYDVFVSYFVPEKKVWSYPVNMGYPINTADDDVHFIYSADGSKGYFASHRADSYGEKDIYTVKNPNPDPKMIVMTGLVLDNETKLPVDATITVTNLETKQVIGVYNTNKETGKYILALNYDVNHSVEISSKGYVFSSENVYVPRAFFKKQHSKDFEVKKAALATLTTNEIDSLTMNTAISGGNITSDGGAPVMERGVVWSTSTGPTFDMGTKTLDSIGSGTYKSIISGLAPNTTYYLRAYATNGVGTAYGNEITFKTTEVVVVLPIKSDTAESDEIAVKLPDLKNKTVFMSRIKEGARIQLNNIFFDHDKSTLREESIVELELLRSILMDNPTWLVEISGHTDDNGSEEHNLALSRARALAVVNYLVSNGINPKHMIAIGYGESKPAVENTTPENRQINRRTEFMILKTNVKHASTGGHGGKYKPLKLHNVLIESTLQGQDNSYKLKPEVHFINEGIDLTRYSRKQLDLVVAQLKDDKIFKLTLIPSVDVVGNEYNNKALYEKRAEKVLNYLVSKGLSRENITVQEFVPTNNPQETDLSKADIQKRSVLLFVSH